MSCRMSVPLQTLIYAGQRMENDQTLAQVPRFSGSGNFAGRNEAKIDPFLGLQMHDRGRNC